MKRKIAFLFLALALLMPFLALADEPHVHQWGSAVVTKKRTCTEDGIKTSICLICGATMEKVYKAYGHHFGEWSYNPQDKPGMLSHQCEYCHLVEYRYCPPLRVDDFPIAEVLADATRDMEGGVTVLHEDMLLSAEEREKMDALSPHDRILVFLCVIGFEEQVHQLRLGGDTFSEEAAAVLEAIRGRVDALTGEEAAAFAENRETYFPYLVISMNPTNLDYQQTYLTLCRDEADNEDYGFARRSGEWSFCRLEDEVFVIEIIEETEDTEANEANEG